jgi:hypothetical protein
MQKGVLTRDTGNKAIRLRIIVYGCLGGFNKNNWPINGILGFSQVGNTITVASSPPLTAAISACPLMNSPTPSSKAGRSAVEKAHCEKQKTLFTTLGNPQRRGFSLSHRLDYD